MMHVEVMQECASISGPLTTHAGEYDQTDMFSERHWPQCSCPAFKFTRATVMFGGILSKPPCKHILQSELEVCGWHEQLHGSPEEAGTCPRCGGPTNYVRVAV